MSELGPSPLAASDEMLSVDEARAAILSQLVPIDGDELVPLLQALGRVLAADVISPIDVPAHDNSAMDGYAFDGAALRDDAPLELRAAGTVMAGDARAVSVPSGTCVRIMTGAVMPAGADTVVPLELCQVSEDGAQVRIEPRVLKPGENRRRAGEDLKRDHPALRGGRVLRPADLGLIASLGMAQVRVKRRLRVALFSTGDEIRTPGEALDAGCVYDSNRYSLMGALQRLPVEIFDLGPVRDDPAALQDALGAAVRCQADAVLTSGGVSAGDADYTRDVLAQLGEIAFWKIAMRPGRPFAFGALGSDDKPLWMFALPGNPVAALVTFYVFAREALLKLSGAEAQPLPVLQARCTSAIRKRPGRTEFQRAIVAPAAGAGFEVRLTGSQGAGILRSMSEANALLVLGHEQGSVAAGERVDVWLFDGLV